MTGVVVLRGYIDWVKASGASPQTLRLRLHYLGRLAAAHPDRRLLDLSPTDLLGFLSHDGWKPETRKSARAAVRSFYRWAHDVELIERDPSAKLPRVAVPASVPRPTPEDVFIDALLSAKRRERLMALLAGYGGLRRGEIARLHTDDITGDEVRIRGKGERIRTVPLHPRIMMELAWVPPGWVFPNHRTGSHLTPQYVGDLLTELLGPGWSGHTLRHRFATRGWAATKDLFALQEALGHSKPETTKKYTEIPKQAIRDLVFGV